MGRAISALVETKIEERLADTLLGFNPCVLLAAPDYGLDANAERLTIDFSAADSTQFFVGVTDPEDVLEGEDLTWPNLSVATVRSVNANRTVGPGGNFSGEVTAKIFLDISIEDERLPRRASARAGMYEEAMFNCLCSNEPGRRWSPGGGMLWGRDLECVRGAWRDGGMNHAQLLTFTLTFVVENSA